VSGNLLLETGGRVAARHEKARHFGKMSLTTICRSAGGSRDSSSRCGCIDSVLKIFCGIKGACDRFGLEVRALRASSGEAAAAVAKTGADRLRGRDYRLKRRSLVPEPRKSVSTRSENAHVRRLAGTMHLAGACRSARDRSCAGDRLARANAFFDFGQCPRLSWIAPGRTGACVVLNGAVIEVGTE
jgi:hypothetical protein